MKKSNFNKPQRYIPPTDFELATAGKYASFAAYYNVAEQKMLRILKDLGVDKKSDRHYSIVKHIDLLTEGNYITLGNYLYAEFKNNKNSSGQYFEPKNKIRIDEILKVLVNVRNFQSHIYHTNNALIITNNLANFLEELQNEALNYLALYEPSNYSTLLKSKEPKTLFKSHQGDNYLTPEGKIFFLSLFLSTQEMQRFLDEAEKEPLKPRFIKAYKPILLYLTLNERMTRLKYNQSNTFFQGLAIDFQKQLLNHQQAFRIFNYLNKVSEEMLQQLHSILFSIEDNKLRESDLTPFIVSFNQVDFPFKAQWFSKKIIPKTKRGNEIIELEAEAYYVDSIHILNKEKGFTLEFKIKDFVYLFYILKTEGNYSFIRDENRNIASHTDFSNAPSFISHSLKRFINARAKSIDFFESNDEWDSAINEFLPMGIDKGALDFLLRKKEKKENNDTKSFNKEEVISKLKEPIELRFYELFYSFNWALRKNEEFVRYAAYFLIDFANELDGWNWKQIKFGLKEKEDNKTGKISLINERIDIFSPQREEEYSIYIDRLNHTSIKYNNKLYNINENILRMIVIAYFNNNQNLPLLFETIESDLQKPDCPYRIGANNKHFKEDEKINEFKEKINNRIDRYDEIIKSIAEKVIPLSRNEKNRMIMEVYNLFDWHYPNQTEIKFLRKDEYQLMSVFHYTLYNKPNYELIKDFRNRIPYEIMNVIAKKQTLNELLKNVLNLGKSKLYEWQKDIDNAKTWTEKRIKWSKKIGLKFSSNEVNNEIAVYSLVPKHVLHILFPETIENNKASISNSLLKDEKTGNYKSEYLEVLHPFNYQLTDVFKPICNDKKIIKKLIGLQNDYLGKDILLAKMASKYYSTYTTLTHRENEVIPKVWEIRNTPIVFKVKDFNGIKVEVKVSFHNLDDLLFTETIDTLDILSHYFIKIHQIAADVNDLSKQKVVLPYADLMLEFKNILRQAMELSGRILIIEKDRVIAKYKTNTAALNKDKISSGLFSYISFDNILEETEKQIFIGDRKDDVKLAYLRNKSMHANVPEKFTYPALAMDATILNLIKVEVEKFTAYHKSNFSALNYIQTNVNQVN